MICSFAWDHPSLFGLQAVPGNESTILRLIFLANLRPRSYFLFDRYDLTRLAWKKLASFLTTKKEINFLAEIVLLSKEKYIKSQLFWFTFYFKKVYFLPVKIQFLWEGHYFCHWLVLKAVSEFLDLRTKILRTELRPNYLCLSWMVDQIADKIHDLYLTFSWQDHLE